MPACPFGLRLFLDDAWNSSARVTSLKFNSGTPRKSSMTEQNHTGHQGLASGAISGQHSATGLNGANLTAALQAFGNADRVFFADLNELNNSEAEGGALLLLKGKTLTVITAARGVEAGQTHIQHIHGFEDGRDAKVPTLAQDDDRDGFIELAEGLATYGPALSNLTPTPRGRP